MSPRTPFDGEEDSQVSKENLISNCDGEARTVEQVYAVVTFASSVVPSPAAWKSRTLYLLPCCPAAADRTADGTSSSSTKKKMIRSAPTLCLFEDVSGKINRADMNKIQS
jgi:hypothetical protein